MPPRCRVTDADIETMRALNKQGLRWTEVAERIGTLSVSQVRDHAAKHGMRSVEPAKPRPPLLQTAKPVVAQPIPRGVTTLPPLPCLSEPLYVIKRY